MSTRVKVAWYWLLTAALVSLMSWPVWAGPSETISVVRVADATNAARVGNRLGSLALDPLLCRAAQAKAEDMAARGYFGHKTPDGLMPWDFIAAAGYRYQAAAENLAVGFQTEEALLTAWLRSPDHRHNLLNRSYTHLGIGVARGTYKGRDVIFVVQLFGRPPRTAAPPPE